MRTDYTTDLIGNPDLVIELLAVAVKRAGGTMAFKPEDTLGPYNLQATLFDDAEGRKYLAVELFEEPHGNA